MSVSTNNRTCNKTLLEIWQKKENNELEKRNRAFLINQDENGIARVYVGFESEDVRLSGIAETHSIYNPKGSDLFQITGRSLVLTIFIAKGNSFCQKFTIFVSYMNKIVMYN